MELGVVQYDRNVLGSNGPRKMQVDNGDDDDDNDDDGKSLEFHLDHQPGLVAQDFQVGRTRKDPTHLSGGQDVIKDQQGTQLHPSGARGVGEP